MAVAARASGVLDKATAHPSVIADAIRTVGCGEPLIPPAEAVQLVVDGTMFRREEHAVRATLASLTPRGRGFSASLGSVPALKPWPWPPALE